MLLLLLAFGVLTQAERTDFRCDIEIEESTENGYRSQTIPLNNWTRLENVKQVQVLPHNDLFSIETRSAVLQTIRKVDRESLCEQHRTCDCLEPLCLIHITILVIFLPATNKPPLRIEKNVCVRDSNDNRPTFPESVQPLDLNENVKVGTVYDLHSAADLDSERFGVLWYDLQCPNGFFNLSYSIPRKGSHRNDHKVRVTVTKSIPYQSELIACNLTAGDINSNTTIKLLVRINDVNDHRPRWKSTSYSKSIKENVPPDAVVDRFEAVDLDPVFGKVSYSIARIILLSDPSAISEGLFTIDSSSGELRINKALDYEEPTNRKFEVILVAKDNGSPCLSSSATVQISVENVNDNPPIIKLNKAMIDVKENSPAAFMDYFTVTDDDEMAADHISCQIVEPEGLFNLSKSNPQSPIIFEIYSLTSFDFEKQSMLTLIIRCDDGGSPLLSSVRRISINVLDVNDNRVYFLNKIVYASIAENVPIGTEITKLVSVDLDRKSNLIYSMSDPSNCSFVNLDSYHGYLTSNEVFDRETKDLYWCRIKVEEKDFSDYSDTAEVYLRITDTNDNSPVFKEPYTFSVAENASINSLVGRVEAVDPDLGNNGTVSYHHGPQAGDGPEYFRVLSNGEIRLFQQLDFESQVVHNLVLVASDQGSAVTMSTTISVIIKVIDSNDHPPRFEDRSPTLNLQCQTQDIGKDAIAVSDKDHSPENTLVNYDIEKVDPSKYRPVFNINKTSGFMSMTIGPEMCKFKFNIREKVDLTLQIYDPSKREFKDRANLLIYLESDRYDKVPETHNKVSSNDGSNTWFNKKKNRPSQPDTEGVSRPEDFVDQNIIIVMILIFITIFLGIILISLVCFVRRRRQRREDQDVAERMGMMTSPPHHDKLDYMKNIGSYGLTMNNVAANDGYFQTITNDSRINPHEMQKIAPNQGKAENPPEGTLFAYETSKVKDSNAYQTLTMNVRPEEQYSIIESFLVNRDIAQGGSLNNNISNPINPGNKPYVSVSFV